MAYVIAFYEVDRAYGGPEDGGWWFDCGELCRVFATARTEDAAYKIARRANRLLDRLQRGKRDVGSVIYSGGRHSACVFELTAPRYFPETRPYFE